MTQRELTPSDYVAMLRRRWVLIAILAVVGGPIGYGVSRALPETYRSQTLVLVRPATVSTDIVKPVDVADVSQRLASMRQQILSRSRLEPVIHQFGLFPKDIDRVPMEDLVERLQKSIEVSAVEPMALTRATNLPGFFVAVTLDTSKGAQEVCGAITSMFIAEDLKVTQENSEDTTEFLSQQLLGAKAKLDEQDAKLAAFKGGHLGALPDQEQTNLNLLGSLNSQVDAATQALSRAQQDKSFAESILAQQISTWQESQTGRNPETLEQQLSALQTELTTLQARYTDDYPDVVKAKASVEAMKKKIADAQAGPAQENSGKSTRPAAEPQQIQQLRAQIRAYDQAIAERVREQDQLKQQVKVYQSRLQSSPTTEEQYKALTRDYQTALDFYNDLLKKRNQSAMATDLTRKQQGEQFSVLDPANRPDKPSFPDRTIFTGGGAAIGLGLGLGLALLLELQNTSMRTEGDVERILHLPVLATVPQIELPSGKKSKRAFAQHPADPISLGTGS